MTQDAINLCDELNVGDIIEVYYIAIDGSLRVSVGSFLGFSKDYDGDWVIQRTNRPDIKTLDVREMVVLTKANA